MIRPDDLNYFYLISDMREEPTATQTHRGDFGGSSNFLKQQNNNDHTDSGSSILDGPIGSTGLYSKNASSNYLYQQVEKQESSSKYGDYQAGSSGALQQIKRDAERRENSISSWMSEARKSAPSANATSEIEDLRDRNQIFREALRCMSFVTSRELEELRHRNMRLDCELIRIEGELRAAGCRLDCSSMAVDEQQINQPKADQQQEQQQQQQQFRTSKYAEQQAKPTFYDANQVVESMASKYFGKTQPQQQQQQQEQPSADGMSVRCLLNRISELECRVHELSEARITTERRAACEQPTVPHASRSLLGQHARGSSAQPQSRRYSPAGRSTSRTRQPSADMWPVIRQLEDKLDMMTKKTLSEEEMIVVRSLLTKLKLEQTSSPRQPTARKTRSPSPLTTNMPSTRNFSAGFRRDTSVGRRVSPQRASTLADWLHQPSASANLGEPLMSQAKQTAAAHQQMRASHNSTLLANSTRSQAMDRSQNPACMVATGYPAPMAHSQSHRGRSISPPAGRSYLRTARLSPVMSGQRPVSPSHLIDNYSAAASDEHFGADSPHMQSTYMRYAATAAKSDSLSNGSLNGGSQVAIDSVAGKRPFVPRQATDVRLGDIIKFTRQGGRVARGHVRYVGHLPGREDSYLGVELESQQEGKHDGIYEGKRYFKW